MTTSKEFENDYVVPPHDGISVFLNKAGTITIQADDQTGVERLITFHPRHVSEICRAIRRAAKFAPAHAAYKLLVESSEEIDHENTNN